MLVDKYFISDGVSMHIEFGRHTTRIAFCDDDDIIAIPGFGVATKYSSGVIDIDLSFDDLTLDQVIEAHTYHVLAKKIFSLDSDQITEQPTVMNVINEHFNTVAE